MIISLMELLAGSNINYDFSKTRENQVEMHRINALFPYLSYK